MTETAVQDVATPAPVKTPKKKGTTPKAKSASKKVSASHPPTAQMVDSAIKSLKERGGSSLQAIKKYVASTYKVDVEKTAPFIKKYLKSAADSGKLIRTKGTGAQGSFKLPAGDAKKSGDVKKTKKPKSTAAKKPKSAKPKAASATAGTTTPKKPKVKKTKASKPITPKKAPSKVKKAAKSPAAKKPRTPKPKKAAPKKTAAKKPVTKK